ncbi:MAG TPA: PA14 domain-containing protein, partial [Puia sp.]|nr:PA14 domain-containing protein [Puia sp.]
MIINTLNRYARTIGWVFYFLFCSNCVLAAGGSRGAVAAYRYSGFSGPYSGYDIPYPGYRRPYSVKDLFPERGSAAATSVVVGRAAAGKPEEVFGGGPGQPEMQAFQSVNANNMVDLFSGDFSYNIPLMDVGGYPVNISYRSGISMDQEASWVGLGWNINPGTITRNMRGLPDDFNGKDSIKKVAGIRENKTVGVTGGGGGDVELAGFPINVGLGANVGILYNNYKGWGLENGINASINAGGGSKGSMTGGLGLQAENSSQDGLTLTPSLSLEMSQNNADESAGVTGSFSTALPYNSRYGLKGLQLSVGERQYQTDDKNQRFSTGGSVSGVISFASHAFTPTITLPITSNQYTFTAKLGLAETVFHPSFYISGYVSSQTIAPADTLLSLPAYGYLHYQDGVGNANALFDMNREKELPYHDKPTVPHIAVPFYTYDAFSITGEGTGGMFRAYRGDIGYIHDHFIRTRDASDRLSVDVGVSSLVHAGADLNLTRSFTQTGPWLDQNTMQKVIDFKKDSVLFEAAYFRNPGEKSINQKSFYDAIGGDDVVAVKLFQPGNSSSVMQATSYLTHYRNKAAVGENLLTPQNAFRSERDKRTQVISYLDAEEADAAGLSKYIENYGLNQFSLTACVPPVESEAGLINGLIGEYFPNPSLSGTPYVIQGDSVTHDWGNGGPAITVNPPLAHFPGDQFSIRWTGRLQAPVTGTYNIQMTRDDSVRLWLNDSLITHGWTTHHDPTFNTTVNLVAGEFYNFKLEFHEHGGVANLNLKWKYPGLSDFMTIPKQYFFPPAADSFADAGVVREKRVNDFRKANHISEIDVLNSDGRKYVYGIPVYNLRQKEATFSVDGHNRGNVTTGLVGFNSGVDNTVAGNQQGKDHYFNSEEIPAYAHSFLLTGIVSPDYVDRTGNGISDDDQGDAVKFNYSKVCGIGNPYRWRAPYIDSATFSEGLKTDSRDDKGNYVYGEKELWYLHTIESRTMIATFTVENRADLWTINETGQKQPDSTAKRLKEINLYSKADFLKNGTNAIPVKTVHFEYSYDLCPGVNQGQNTQGKLTLKKIWFTYNGNDKGKQNPYLFNYNALNPAYTIRSYDRWGNYKDALQNPGSTPSNVINNAEYPYALQDSTMAATNAAAWTLDSIYLPSGGAIKVAYESDDYAYVQNLRSANLFKLAGFSPDSLVAHVSSRLYNPGGGDNLYAFVNVPMSVSSKADLYQRYLAGNTKLYFKVFVRMPDDQYGSGWEYVSCYADLDAGNSYGIAGPGKIWIKISGISLAGDGSGTYNPLAKAAIQFLRLNLPSKAYPGSEPGDNLDVASAVKMIFSLANNIATAFSSFDGTARGHNWCSTIDVNRSYIRLDNPFYKKLGGGHRVKQITIFDNWNKMVAGSRAAVYGQAYTYTTQQVINGDTTTISSGVASYEPGIGGEENLFHQPIEYVEAATPLGPTTLGYSEEPLGESVFPAAGVGYSKVRVRTINYKGRKSANGYEESTFYTAYDFPTYTDRSLLDNDTKKRYKPALSNLLRIDARNFLTMSQGFKVELNDMHGKLRSQAYYPETDPSHYTSYTENFYRVEDPMADAKRLSNTVRVMNPDGTIDTAAFIGKDAELMVDMREQLSVTNGYNLSPNIDMFEVPFLPPLFVIPDLINLAQREQDQFRSVAALKVIQRYGILDSVIHIDKGSKVSTKDLLYDSETGDVLLTRTQNEFNDPVYNFSYPSHWSYDGMGLAYKNIDLLLKNVYIKSGKLFGAPAADSLLFSGGDEVLVAGRQQTGGAGCSGSFATFPDYTKIWAVDSSAVRGGPKAIYFVDRAGVPYNDSAVSLKVVRSGRRNMNSMVGSVTTLHDPQVWNGSALRYELKLDSGTGVVNAASSEFGQFWKVEDRRVHRTTVNCVDTIPADCSGGGTSCSCQCLKTLFDYLISSHRLFIKQQDNVTVSTLVQNANAAGYTLSVNDCPVLQYNQNKPFYAMTTDSVTNFYAAMIGGFLVEWNTAQTVNMYHFKSSSCGGSRTVSFIDSVDSEKSRNVVSKTFYVTKSMNYYENYLQDSSVYPLNYGYEGFDTSGTQILFAEYSHSPPYPDYLFISNFFKFDSVSSIPSEAFLQSASLSLYADPNGFFPP